MADSLRNARQPVLGLVPARAGSKGIVGKNMRLIDGDPMVAHTLRAARDSGVLDRLVVSTEGNEIAQWCTRNGYEVMTRPDELASDEITIAQVARQVIDELDWHGLVVALLPTSPLRSADSIRRAVERAQTEDIDSLATVVREPKLFWFDTSEDLSNPRPLYAERVNRQFGKHGVLRETGAILPRANGLVARGRRDGRRAPCADGAPVCRVDRHRHLRRPRRRQANQRAGADRLSNLRQLGGRLGPPLELPRVGRGAHRARHALSCCGSAIPSCSRCSMASATSGWSARMTCGATSRR